MSNLLNDTEGRNVVLEMQRFLLRRRISRFCERSLVVDYENWSHGVSEFDLGTLITDLNVAWDDELRDLYRLLGAVGGLPESIADTDLYIDPATGSDVTGTGSADRPYASMWFLDLLPKKLSHTYNIILLGDVTITDFNVSMEFEGDGCLNFIGRGAVDEPYPGLASPITATTQFLQAWRENTMTIAPTSALMKTFAQATIGGAVGVAAPVNRIDNANLKFWCRFAATAGYGPGDNVRFIRPQHTLTFARGSLHAYGGEDMDGDFVNYRGSRINCINLILDIDNPEAEQTRLFSTSGLPMGFWFCQFSCPETNYYAVIFKNKINIFNPVTPAATLAPLANTNVVNMFLGSYGARQSAGLMFIDREDLEFDASHAELLIEESELACVDCMSAVYSYHDNFLFDCSCKYFYSNGGSLNLSHVAFDPNNPVIPECASFNNSIVSMLECLVGTANSGFSFTNCKARISNCGGDAAGTMTSLAAYALYLIACSTVSQPNAWNGTSGTTNDCFLEDTATAGAFPGAGAALSDALWNCVARHV